MNTSNVTFGSGSWQLSLDPQTACLASFQYGAVELIAPATARRPLLTLRFRDAMGNPELFSSLDLGTPQIETNKSRLLVSFDARATHQIDVRVAIALGEGEETRWSLEIDHGRTGYLEWIELPRVVVPNNLIGVGGHGTLFWPALEGVLVENLEHREASWLRYGEADYPNAGWMGYYPGAAPMQFMAYMNGDAGLYFASHDPSHATKEIEYAPDPDGIRLIHKVFVGAAPAGVYKLPYEVVLSGFRGDWHDAAERYRKWTRSGGVTLPPPIQKRKDVPEWIGDSPVVVIYPVTGVGHHAGPTQPNEYFPFPAALPAVETLAEKLESRLLVALMHWEGTAPWSPPYVWPPIGGEASLKEFIEKLHANSHLLGLYCSGLAWTNRSQTGPGDYNRLEEFERDHLIRHMCRGPQGQYACLICNGEDIRYGYDICTASAFAPQVMTEEALKMAAAGVDYIQLFDQNLGGASYQCYDAAHGHAPAPGPWQPVAMNRVLTHVREALAQGGHARVVLGCEAASAEPYLNDLPVNDLRFFMGWAYGRPVPAYSYVFHEYGCNFMGNQVGALDLFDQVENPWNLTLRFAHSFIAGDLMTLILKDHGQIHWAWCTKWDVEGPPQEKHLEFVRTLNAWRQGAGKSFLYGGKMLAPLPVTDAANMVLTLRDGGTLNYPAVLTSRWQDEAGAVAQFLVNFTEVSQQVTLHGDGVGRARLFIDPASENGSELSIQNQAAQIEVPPLRAVLVRFE